MLRTGYPRRDMQTFLPFAGFTDSAAALDVRRLGKQRVETLQILRALVWPSYGWKNHPAVKMWRGFVPALVLYGVAICQRWSALGHDDTVLPQLLAFTGGQLPDGGRLAATGQLPPWLGEPAVHLSHQSSLLRKDPDHYRPLFGPDVPDDLPYAWPAPAFPFWPLRRGHADGLDPAEAATLLGITPPDDVEAAALCRVVSGRDAELSGPDPVRLGAVGLLAGLSTPGPTAWLGPARATRPQVDVMASVAPADPVFGRGRQPDADAVAAMRSEAVAEPEFLFFPSDEPAMPAEVGLVVLDRVAGAIAVTPGVPVLRLRADDGSSPDR
ncbi:MAG TPA: MSMEG_6728 family protein [Pseudonocardiaceae bacterium]|nr:MSMEG_6728 family protein [Pseudonocardiaceae bacterium]